jgi:hypothetical protein
VRGVNLKHGATMAVADLVWEAGGATYVVVCGCSRRFGWPWNRERVRCPSCGAEAYLPTLQREWGDVPFEVTEAGYLKAYQRLRQRIKALVEYNEQAKPEEKVTFTRWMQRIVERWQRETRESTSA